MTDAKRALTMSYTGQRKPLVGKPRPTRPAWKKQLFSWTKREKLHTVERSVATPVA